ncbi:MAG: hypothetical protein IBX45_00250 [Campylobacterales bacterium]|nr:hypothetical protein [Campylobacterales bacterium]
MKWLLFAAFTLPLYAKVEWAHQYRFVLEKDEWASVFVYPEYLKDEVGGGREEYRFSWTLYDTTNLVVHTRFRGFPKQHTLSLRRGLETVIEPLLVDPANRIAGKAELWLVFEGFDAEKKVAFLEVYIQDRQKRVLIEFDDPRRRREE